MDPDQRVRRFPILTLPKPTSFPSENRDSDGLYGSPIGIIELKHQSPEKVEVNVLGLSFQGTKEGHLYKLKAKILFGILNLELPGLEGLSLVTYSRENRDRVVLFSHEIPIGTLGVGTKLELTPSDPTLCGPFQSRNERILSFRQQGKEEI
jgi:hypothetical protein